MAASSRQPALLADIGGTNARFALLRESEITGDASLPVAAYPGPREAIEHFLGSLGKRERPRHAALAFAGPVEGETARLTNGAWEVSAAALRRALGFGTLSLINDFAALAWALPALGSADVVAVGGGEAVPDRPLAVIGPGTGLGVAAFLPGHSGGRVLTTEGGHVTMAPADRREAAVLDQLREDFGHVSAERVISGEGLDNLYRAVVALDGLSVPARNDAEILERGLAGDCPASVAALDLFCAMLGTVAGNLALTLGALGGVYIGGGIVPRFVEAFATSRFRARFESKGRFRDYLARIPTRVIVHPRPAFLGLRNLIERDQ